MHTPAESITRVYLRERVQAVLFSGSENSHRSQREEPRALLNTSQVSMLGQHCPEDRGPRGSGGTGSEAVVSPGHSPSGLLVSPESTQRLSGTTVEEMSTFAKGFGLWFKNDRVEKSQIHIKLTYISFSHIIRVLINIPGKAKITNLHHVVLR